jgi:hypothetical protein
LACGAWLYECQALTIKIRLRRKKIFFAALEQKGEKSFASLTAILSFQAKNNSDCWKKSLPV